MSQNQQNTLKPSDLEEFYAGLIIYTAQRKGITLSDAQLEQEIKYNISDDIQNIISDICSLNSDRFIKGYRQFVCLINKFGADFSDIPNKKTLKQIHNYIIEVPQLMQVYDTILLYRDYERLVNTVGTMDFKPQSINRFEHRVNQISKSLPKDDGDALQDGVSELHALYAQKLLQRKKGKTIEYELFILPEDYLVSYYQQVAINEYPQETDQKKLKQLASQLKSEDLQQIQDCFCSFNEQSCNEAFAKFQSMTGFDDIKQENNLSELDPDDISAIFNNYIQNVPELVELYDLRNLSKKISELNAIAKHPTAQTIYHEDILEFYQQILSHRESSKELYLSDANLANFEYNLISLCQKCDDPSFELYKRMCYDVLYLSDNPQHIAEIYNLFIPPKNNEIKPFRPSHNINEVVKNSCNRILETRRDCLSQQEFYKLYFVLGQSYYRSQNKAGFKMRDDWEHMQESNANACEYFELAYEHAQTPSDAEDAASKVYEINPSNYSSKTCAKRFPFHENRREIFEPTHQPYGSSRYK